MPVIVSAPSPIAVNTLHVLGEIELDGALNHDGASAGFFSKAPVARPAAIGDPVGGIVTDGEARAAVVGILTALESLGLIAT